MHTKKFKISVILIVVVLSVILAANSRNIANPLRIKVIDALSPLLKSVYSAYSAAGRALPFASLRLENKILRGRIELMDRKMQEMKVLSDENARLKTLLDFKKTVPYATIPAQVIGRDPANWSNSLIINKGLKQGVTRNRAVISTKGLVGRLVEVGRYSSKILLITDPNSRVGVIIQRNRQGGILVGRPDGKCKMIYISLDSDTAVGDKVISAGFGSIFPKDILIGEVVKVGKEPGRLYKYAIVEPSDDMSRLEEVLCIR